MKKNKCNIVKLGGIKAVYLAELSAKDLKREPVFTKDIEIKSGPENLHLFDYPHTINFTIHTHGVLKGKLSEWLKGEIQQCERTAEEYIQELDNQEGCDQEMKKVEAYQNVLKLLL